MRLSPIIAIIDTSDGVTPPGNGGNGGNGDGGNGGNARTVPIDRSDRRPS